MKGETENENMLPRTANIPILRLSVGRNVVVSRGAVISFHSFVVLVAYMDVIVIFFVYFLQHF